jgi:hypothetical protein
MPKTLNNAKDSFCAKMEPFLEHLPEVRTIVDDIVVYGKDMADHDKNLDRLLRRHQTQSRQNGNREI